MRIYQYYNTNDDDDRDGYTANWMAQTFTPVLTHMISKVKLKLFRVGDPGTITVSIKATSDGKPVGADLCSGVIEGTDLTLVSTGEWYEITLGDGYTFTKNVQYAIVVRAPSGDASNKVSWRADITTPTFTGGTFCSSSDSGVDWSTVSGVDCMFEEWGTGEASPTTVVWGNLLKSQISAEKIEEAINRIIQGHEDDPDAHIEIGESLQSHKASVVIDHIVDSIISDKIASGEITRPKLSDDAMVLATDKFDKGIYNEFSDWLSAVVGSGSIVKKARLNHVKTGTTASSIAKVYSEFCQEGSGWNPSANLELNISYYIGENWGWEIANSKIYIKFGMGINADMGIATDKVFGIELEYDSGGDEIYATFFVRNLTNLVTSDPFPLGFAKQNFTFTIKKIGSIWYCYIDGVLKDTLTRDISGYIGNPYITHVAANTIINTESEGKINQLSYYFPWT